MESFQELCFRAMVELGGGCYQGIQEGQPEIGLEPLVLFAGPCGSTLGLKFDDVSAEAVRKAIAAKEEEYEAFARTPEQVWLPRAAA